MQLLTAATRVRPSSRLPTTFCSTCRQLDVVSWRLCGGHSQQCGPALVRSRGRLSDMRGNLYRHVGFNLMAEGTHRIKLAL